MPNRAADGRNESVINKQQEGGSTWNCQCHIPHPPPPSHPTHCVFKLFVMLPPANGSCETPNGSSLYDWPVEYLAIINITNFSHYEISHASPNDCLSNPGCMGIIASLAPNRPNTNTPILPLCPLFSLATNLHPWPMNLQTPNQSIHACSDKCLKTVSRLTSSPSLHAELSANTALDRRRSLENICETQLQYHILNVVTLIDSTRSNTRYLSDDDVYYKRLWKLNSFCLKPTYQGI
jgi:hypothetical protein